MSRINTLTKEQKAALAPTAKKWIKRALRTDWDPEAAAHAAKACYRVAGLEEPKTIFCWSSPLAAHLGQALLANGEEVIVSVEDVVKHDIKELISYKINAQEETRCFVRSSTVFAVLDSIRAAIGSAIKESVRDAVKNSVRGSVKNSVVDSVWHSIKDPARNAVWDATWLSIKAAVKASVKASVGDSVWHSVGNSVGNSVRDSVVQSVLNPVFDSINASITAIQKTIEGAIKKHTWIAPYDGAGWCYWRAFYNYFWEQFRIGKELTPHYALDRSGAFWWWWFKDSAHLCAPPKFFRFDQGKEDGSEPYRLHCSDGPAVQWRDGFSLYFWRGVSVPREWIEEPESVTAEMIVKEDNQERKRTLCEVLGWNNALELIEAETVQRDDWGALLKTDKLGDDDGKRATFCKVECPSSGREYLLRVPPDTKTCHAGLAWAAGVSEDDYDFVIET